MFINHRKTAKVKAILFAALFVFGSTLLAASFVGMTHLPHQEIGFWIMLGVCFMGILTVFWSALGFIFAMMDYKELS